MNGFVETNQISKSSLSNQQTGSWSVDDRRPPNADSRVSPTKAGSVFVREGTLLPRSLQPSAFDNCEWLHAGDVSAIEKKLHAAGGHYLQLMGKEIAVTMFGMHPIEALRKATLRSLERVPEHRNAIPVALIVTGGRLLFDDGHATGAVGAGEMLLINPGERHT